VSTRQDEHWRSRRSTPRAGGDDLARRPRRGLRRSNRVAAR